jgi:tetratricopeptide (TPR) repeat protein
MVFQSFSINKADSLFSKGEYFNAAVEYERAYFYAKGYKEKNEFKYKKSICYKNIGDFEAAKDEILKIRLFGIADSVRNKYLYQMALLSYLSEDFYQCEKALLQISGQEVPFEIKSNTLLLGCLNNIALRNFEESQTYGNEFLTLVVEKRNLDSVLLVFNGFYSKKNLPKLRKGNVFKWVSIIPGMGQIYVGKIGEGISNMCLNAGAFAFGGFQIYVGNYFTGYFVGTLAINKFYFGGRTRAKSLFDYTNKEKINGFSEKIGTELKKW